MTVEQKEIINAMRLEGNGYRVIAGRLGLSPDSVKSWCRRHPVETAQTDVCMKCGAPVSQTPHKRRRRFCSDKCRLEWWSKHPEMRSPGKYEHKCGNCGKTFFNRRAAASYCSRECYASARRRDGGCD